MTTLRGRSAPISAFERVRSLSFSSVKNMLMIIICAIINIRIVAMCMARSLAFNAASASMVRLSADGVADVIHDPGQHFHHPLLQRPPCQAR